MGMNWEEHVVWVCVTGVFLASDTGVFLISAWVFTFTEKCKKIRPAEPKCVEFHTRKKKRKEEETHTNITRLLPCV